MADSKKVAGTVGNIAGTAAAADPDPNSKAVLTAIALGAKLFGSFGGNNSNQNDSNSEAVASTGTNDNMQIIQTLANPGSQFLGNNAQQKARDAEYNAYVNYLNNLDKKRTETEGKFENYYQIGDEQFNQEANTQLPEVHKMQEDINNQSTEAQENMSSQMQSQLAQQGVRGGQASTILGRATGNLNKNLNYDQNQIAYYETRNRQNARLNYTSQKAMKPYNTLTSAQWFYMPSPTEMSMMSNAINRKFGA